MTADIQPAQIFFPYAFERQKAVKSQGIRFVHYTRADAAMSIIKTKAIWMRKTSCMNDFMEVHHGLGCLTEAYNGEVGAILKENLNVIFSGITNKIEQLFNGWVHHFASDTYVTCFSKHLAKEDSFGRLSMWRAYGETTGVALVVNNTPFLSSSDALKAYSSPVAYLDKKAFQKELAKVADGIKGASDIVRAQGQDAVVSYIFNAFKFAALCTKHPGFREEMEWRVIYTPAMDNSTHLTKDIQVVGGTPQPIYKIPLKDIPEEGLEGIAIPELLDRIIIGPTNYAPAMREAFEALLADAGVTDPASRIYVSDLPLRT